VRKKGGNGSSTLPWSVGYKVAIGIAEAMAYLHNVTQRRVFIETLSPLTFFFLLRRLRRCDFRLATWT